MAGPIAFSDYEAHDALGLAALVATGEVTASELLETALARADADEPALHALVHRFDDLARAEIARGLPSGPFTGVPFVLKNTGFEAQGTLLSTGSRLFANAVSARDTTLVARYRAAGLVIFAKTNTPEFALSFTSEPEAFGPSRNPYDLARSPGGSSGGSAAAVAAGYLPLANSSDGAGSTRVPASHCGLFGFKPSRMTNPLGPVAVEGIAGMSTPHALSRSVRDNAALLDATAGPDIGDPYASVLHDGSFLDAVSRPPRRLRIGYTPQAPLGEPVDPEVAAIVEEGARFLGGLGHVVDHAEHGYDAAALKAAWKVIAGVNVLAGARARAGALGLSDLSGWLEPVNLAWIDWAAGLPATAYLAAVNTLHQSARALGRFFTRYDVLLSPVATTAAVPLGTLAGAGRTLDQFYDAFWGHAPFTAVFNASGAPAMAVPFGRTAGGLPVGLHLGAAFGADRLLFQLAGEIEQARPWAHSRPPRPLPGDRR